MPYGSPEQGGGLGSRKVLTMTVEALVFACVLCGSVHGSDYQCTPIDPRGHQAFIEKPDLARVRPPRETNIVAGGERDHRSPDEEQHGEPVLTSTATDTSSLSIIETSKTWEATSLGWWQEPERSAVGPGEEQVLQVTFTWDPSRPDVIRVASLSVSWEPTDE